MGDGPGMGGVRRTRGRRSDWEAVNGNSNGNNNSNGNGNGNENENGSSSDNAVGNDNGQKKSATTKRPRRAAVKTERYSEGDDASDGDYPKRPRTGSSNSGELLTAAQKKANHVASEKKRREAIREGFSRMTMIVPGLDASQSRSEATVLAKTVEFLRMLVNENKMLTQLAEEHDISLPQPPGDDP